MMKKSLLILVTAFASVELVAQAAPSTGSGFDYHALFSPLFYTHNGNEYRAANGEPGPAYWQNKASYQIDAVLNDSQKEVTATVTLDYTNNSPHQLPYIWLQLDQNLFNDTSRGHAKMPATGRSRYGDASSEFKGGFRLQSVKLVNGQTQSNASYIITDTRMQVRLD